MNQTLITFGNKLISKGWNVWYLPNDDSAIEKYMLFFVEQGELIRCYPDTDFYPPMTINEDIIASENTINTNEIEKIARKMECAICHDMKIESLAEPLISRAMQKKEQGSKVWIAKRLDESCADLLFFSRSDTTDIHSARLLDSGEIIIGNLVTNSKPELTLKNMCSLQTKHLRQLPWKELEPYFTYNSPPFGSRYTHVCYDELEGLSTTIIPYIRPSKEECHTVLHCLAYRLKQAGYSHISQIMAPKSTRLRAILFSKDGTRVFLARRKQEQKCNYIQVAAVYKQTEMYLEEFCTY